MIVTDSAVPRSNTVQDAAPEELDEAVVLWVVAGDEADDEVVWKVSVWDVRVVPPQPVSIKEARSTENAAASEPRPSMP